MPEPAFHPRLAVIADRSDATGEPPDVAEMAACAEEFTPAEEAELFDWWCGQVDKMESLPGDLIVSRAGRGATTPRTPADEMLTVRRRFTDGKDMT